MAFCFVDNVKRLYYYSNFLCLEKHIQDALRYPQIKKASSAALESSKELEISLEFFDSLINDRQFCIAHIGVLTM